MAKYKATVCRTSYGFTDIEVEANNQEEAEQKILDEAGDHNYSEKTADYTLDGGAYTLDGGAIEIEKYKKSKKIKKKIKKKK